MKTRFFLVGMMAAALLSGCSQDEVVESLDMNQAIGFGTYVGTQTKASEQTIGTIKGAGKGFGVYAYYTKEDSYNSNSSTPELNFMENVHVTFNNSNSAWEYSPLRYWMNGTDMISFFAYAPFLDTNITNKPVLGADGDPTVDFTVQNTVTSQTDLLYASAIDQTKNGLIVDDVLGKVKFTFNHALSRIAVYAKISDDYYSDSEVEIVVTGITLTGKPNTSGTLNLCTGVWTATNLAQNSIDYRIGLNSNNTTLSTSEQQLNTANDYLMIIPTDMSTTGFTVTVNYNITQAGVSSSNQVTGIIKNNFIKGKAYKVVLNVGLDAIKFDVDAENGVDGWGNESEISSTL